MDIALVKDDSEREAMWESFYFEKHGTLASHSRRSAMEEFWNNPSIGKLNEAMKKDEMYREMVKSAGKSAADEAIVHGVHRLVAHEVVKQTVKGAASHTGRQGAVLLAVNEGSKLAAARGVNMVVSSMTSFGISITAAVGEILGKQTAEYLAVDSPRVKNVMGVSGAAAGGAAAGACVGGPIGALAGAGVGVAGWGIGQTVESLMRVGKGPDDNCCYCEIGDIGDAELCFGTYAGDDTLMWKAYWNVYKRTNSEWVMSAGQSPSSPFKLCIWHGWTVLQHFERVYHRDLIRVVQDEHGFVVIHCKGENHPSEAGTTHILRK